MANCVPYTLKVVAKNTDIFQRLLKILNYKDPEYFIYRVYDAKMTDEEDTGDGYFTCEFVGNVAWGCSPWINDKENVNDIHEETGSHYTSLTHLAEQFGFAFELYCEDPAMMFQEYWRVNAKGELVDEEQADEWDEETGEGGLEHYNEFSDPKEVYELGKGDLKKEGCTK